MMTIVGVCWIYAHHFTESNLAQAKISFNARQIEQQARHFLYLIRKSVDLSTDTQINEYVYGLARKLASNSKMDVDPLSYHVVADPAINAFAGPGATFFINTGIIEAAENEGQLASVIAHELAHHKQKHLRRLFEDYQSTMIPSALLILAGIAAGGDAGIAALAGAQAVQTEAMIDHTLIYEREADAVGIQILTASGYSPLDARDFMVTLEERIREKGLFQSNIHNTHPITPERIASFQARVKRFEDMDKTPQSMDFHFVKARTRLLFDWESNNTFKHFKKQITNDDDMQQLAARYGYALSLSKDGKTDSARKAVAELRNQHPDNPWFLLAAAEVEMDANAFDAAKQLLSESALAANPELAVIEMYTRALIHTGELDLANAYMRDHLADHPDKPPLYKLQAETALKTGDTLNGYLAEVEYLFRFGELEAALNLLTVAERKLDDHYSTEVLKEKKRVLQEELDQRS